MKSLISFTLLFLLGFAAAGLPGGWNHGSTELTPQTLALIKFGLQEISKANNGFPALEYQPVKILDFISQSVAGGNYKILAEIDNNKNTLESKKLLHLFISGAGKQLRSWHALDSTANFEPLTSESVLESIKAKLVDSLVYEDKLEGRPEVIYTVSKIPAAFQTKQYGGTLYHVKVNVQGTDNCIRLYEYWFDENYEVIAHARLPLNPETLESHPQLTLARDAGGLLCENLSSYFFCEIAIGCSNYVLQSGKCEGGIKQ